jgi:hypothetical protein
MDWQDILLIILTVWAVVHTYMDMQQSKRIDKLEK